MRLEGREAIEYAATNGLLLSKYADPTEDARDGLTVDEARAVAREDPKLIYLDVDKGITPVTNEEITRAVAALKAAGEPLNCDWNGRLDSASRDAVRWRIGYERAGGCPAVLPPDWDS